MFSIPDKGEGANDTQSVLFQEYLDVLVAGMANLDYVVSGCEVTNDGTDLVLGVSAGWAVTNGKPYQITAGTATIGTADATNPRLDLVVISSSGAIAVRAGTAGATPKPPARTANDVVLAAVYVPANDTGIAQNQIVDLRVIHGVPESCIRVRRLVATSSGTYTPGANVAAFAVLVSGATGGRSTTAGRGGGGGGGYSEKWYKSPSGSYTYAIGAAGSTSGTDGGTTTFGTAEISVTGGGGVTGTTGGAGGVGSGGDFNATGGTGGNGYGVATTAGGGSGGAGSRAGNGGNGGDAASGVGGSGGGTGGNNASGTTPGAAGTVSASALQFPGLTTAPAETGVFAAGSARNVANGGYGAAGASMFKGYNAAGIDLAYSPDQEDDNTGFWGCAQAERGLGTSSSSVGRPGHTTIIEYLK